MVNNRNYKNPTVIAWEQLRLMLQSFSDRMKQFDNMVERQGRDIGVDEVYNEIKNIRQELDKIQSELNLYNNTINTERVVDKSQPQVPFNVQDVRDRKDESRQINGKIHLSESQLHKLIQYTVKNVLNLA